MWVGEAGVPTPSRRISARLSRPTVTSRPAGKAYLRGPSQTINGEANASVGMATPFRAHHLGVVRPLSTRSTRHDAPRADEGTSALANRRRGSRYRDAPGRLAGAESSRTRRSTATA